MFVGTNFRNVEFLYYYLKKFKNYNFVYGSPVELSKKILNNEVSVAPISSVFYSLKKFLIIPEFSISGKRKTGSILLFSKKYNSLDEADNINVGIPENSATSVNLLKIILNLKNIKANFVNFKVKNFYDSLKKNDFVLLIGDDAIFSEENPVCDIGEEYYRITNSGVVYALWMVNKENKNQEEIRNFFYDLKISRDYAYKNFNFVTEEILKDINKYNIKNLMKLRENILSLDYSLDDEKIKWLENFFMHLKEIKIIKDVPELEFFDV